MTMILSDAHLLPPGHDAFNFPWDDHSVESTFLAIDSPPLIRFWPENIIFPSPVLVKGPNNGIDDESVDNESTDSVLPSSPELRTEIGPGNENEATDSCTSILNHTIVNGLLDSDDNPVTYPWCIITRDSDKKPKHPTDILPP